MIIIPWNYLVTEVYLKCDFCQEFHELKKLKYELIGSTVIWKDLCTCGKILEKKTSKFFNKESEVSKMISSSFALTGGCCKFDFLILASILHQFLDNLQIPFVTRQTSDKYFNNLFEITTSFAKESMNEEIQNMNKEKDCHIAIDTQWGRPQRSGGLGRAEHSATVVQNLVSKKIFDIECVSKEDIIDKEGKQILFI